jgi:hypothetical protein
MSNPVFLRQLLRGFWAVVLLLGLLGQIPITAQAQNAVWNQATDYQSQVGTSTKKSDNTSDTEVADDFDVVGTITEVSANGSHITYFNSPPMNLQSAYVRFYEWQNGNPGAVQYEQLVPASAMTVTTDPTGAFRMRIPLPNNFNATGRHFVSVQTISDLNWYWDTANANQTLISKARARDRLANGAWTPAASDAAFALYGTQTGAPVLENILESSAPLSGRIRISGVGFGFTQGTSEVRIGGLKAIVTRWTNTRIHAYVPEGLAPGTQPVQVVTANGSSASLALTVTARQAPGGQATWRFQVDSGLITTDPVVGPDGTIYVMDDNGNLYALNPQGALLWATKSGFQGSKLTRGFDGTLYTLADGILRATNPDGTRKWDFTDATLNWTISGPTVGPDGNIYGTTQLGGYGFFSVNPEGQLRWKHPEIVDRIPRDHEIVFSAGQAYINHRINPVPGEWLMAFRMSDGEMVWRREATNESQPLIGPEGRVYVDWLLGVWYTRVFNPDGSLFLQREGQLGSRRFSPDRSKLYTSLNGVTAFDSTTLDVLWNAEIGLPLTGPPTPDPLDRFLVVRTALPGSPGNIFVLDTDGHLVWRQDFTSENNGNIIPSSGPAFSPDGNSFYIGTAIPTYERTNEYSYVYAFATDSRVPITAPVAARAVSRKVHGTATYDIEMPLDGGGIEPRSGGANGAHQIVVSFTTPITAQGATVTRGTGAVSSHNVSGNKIIVNLTGVTNGQALTLRLDGVDDGVRTGPVTATFTTLLGDVTGNGSVNASDVALTKAQVGQAVTEANFRADVTPNGSINASDIGVVKAQSGTSLPGSQGEVMATEKR